MKISDTNGISPETDICGVTLETVAKLMRGLAFVSDNNWIEERYREHGKNHSRWRITDEIGGMRLHLVEDLKDLSLRGDGWMVTFSCDVANSRSAFVYLPAPAGRQLGTSVLVYAAWVKGVEIKSANAFRHDMSILRLFEDQWED